MLQPNKPEYSARFRHSSLLGWVCLFAAGGGGGGGICESIEIPTVVFACVRAICCVLVHASAMP